MKDNSNLAISCNGMNLGRFEIINYNFTTSIKLHCSLNMPCNIWYTCICNSDLHKSLLLLHTFSYTCACKTCASIQYRNSNIFMSLLQSKYLCNIIIHTLMYTSTINVYMHTVQVCNYVCSRPKQTSRSVSSVSKSKVTEADFESEATVSWERQLVPFTWS
jgi:hypothetical protein